MRDGCKCERNYLRDSCYQMPFNVKYEIIVDDTTQHNTT